MFEGSFTAIVTPFKGTGPRTPVDWDAYEKLIAFQDEKGTAGIVACGTTGESPVLSHSEHNRLIEFTVETSKNPVIAGTGSNSTWEAIEMTQAAEDVGAEASLQVCPYYNKPTQEGLFRHFGAVAESVDMPIILYNVPPRTVTSIEAGTMARLAEEYSNVIGVKEASGNQKVWEEIRKRCGKDFLILSGNDGDTYPLMKHYRARGVISVASNLIPGEIASFVQLGLEGDFKEMEVMDRRFSRLFDAMFIESNPIPVKEAMNILGLDAGGYRYPLCEISPENREALKSVMKDLGLIGG
ncbi:MAG: 4-hydroxy-tetrahydrodipicolinate synthase [Euryarchaeota archaeon]|nr:4-hydroxy-tetrahydrodipicolinate synthase [Euryarchaeota archaeon]